MAAPSMSSVSALRALGSRFERVLIPLHWLRGRARRLLRRLCPPWIRKSDARSIWYKNLYQSLGQRALQSGQPGERIPELLLHDIQGNPQQLSRCWEKQPALLVTMSLSCGQTRRYGHALRRLSRRFEHSINTVIIYVVEAHPNDVPSPYADTIWTTTKNQIAGVDCGQPRTLEERIELARRLKHRFRLSTSMLIDAVDDRTWRAFGSAPNVAILVNREGRIVVKQGWFQPQQMTRAIARLLTSPLITADEHV